jgi:hypothetical protein
MVNFIRENKRLIITMMVLIIGAIFLAICFAKDPEGGYPMF